ncbi:MAG TPA: hypothetical protein VFI12_11170 [Thermomicrobiales bacterium]|nr:hypothetical protein [Thermomicrobiales bacterium]
MPLTTTRRSVIAAALLSGLVTRRTGAQTLGKKGSDSPLALLPALPGDPSTILTWADIAGYCKATGIEKPASFDDATTETWIKVGQRIPLNDNLVFLNMNQPWQDLIGFAPWDIDQVGIAFDPPAQLRIYQGAFDPERVARQVTTNKGFTSASAEGFTILDNPSDDLDLTSDFDRISLGNLNHLAVSDSLVLASRSKSVRDAAIAVAGGDQDAVARMPEFADVAEAIGGEHGFILLNGSILGPGYAGRDAGSLPGVIPPARLFFGSIRVDGDDWRTAFAADLGDPVAAADAIAVVEERIATQSSVVARTPYTELLGDPDVESVAGTGIVRVLVTEEHFDRRWMNVIFAGDLLFLATE